SIGRPIAFPGCRRSDVPRPSSNAGEPSLEALRLGRGNSFECGSRAGLSPTHLLRSECAEQISHMRNNQPQSAEALPDFPTKRSALALGAHPDLSLQQLHFLA